LSDAWVYAPEIRALLGSAAHFCEVFVLQIKNCTVRQVREDLEMALKAHPASSALEFQVHFRAKREQLTRFPGRNRVPLDSTRCEEPQEKSRWVLSRPHGGLRTCHRKLTCLCAVDLRALYDTKLVTLTTRLSSKVNLPSCRQLEGVM